MGLCFLFGNRDCPDSVLPDIEAAVIRCFNEQKITAFYVGNRGQFDRLAATAVKRTKLLYPEIQLHLVLAYHPSERPFILPLGFDDSYYPPLEHVPRQLAIVQANRHMVALADHVICYAKYPGNARALLEYVKKRNVSIADLSATM